MVLMDNEKSGFNSQEKEQLEGKSSTKNIEIGQTDSPSNGEPSRKAQILNQPGFQVKFQFEETILNGNEAQNVW
ncbi:4860_t:CDS:2 [Diversispora eburnea]|uniref:4860_t:CDS:1 n=1 Tax=Diversispora eburnea TaxID=1213867 RepID=A0A9N9CP63_9GLOM|nr:4860_t:CDS:2 [Diversispora eburnea]